MVSVPPAVILVAPAPVPPMGCRTTASTGSGKEGVHIDITIGLSGNWVGSLIVRSARGLAAGTLATVSTTTCCGASDQATQMGLLYYGNLRN